MSPAIGRLVTFCSALMITVAIAELANRWLDGYVVVSLALRPSPSGGKAPERDLHRPDLRHVPQIALARGVDPSWYDRDPPTIRRVPSEEVTRRTQQYPSDPIGAVLVWNREYLREELCDGNRTGSLGILADFFVFDPPDQKRFPIFRHLPNASPPGSFTSNSFGWRGPDIASQKPDNTIRIAFVGASTTVSAHHFPFSHPEHVGHWLNLWARARSLRFQFEVVNAGRTGIDSSSIEAIVRQEILPVDPDIVIYYEGANQFAPGKAMRMPATLAPKPAITFRQRWAAEGYSALARRVLTALDMLTANHGAEPSKPPYPTIWPTDVDEANPDVTQIPLPMDLHNVVRNLDSMRSSLQGIDSELALSSFIWLVYPGMKVDLERHLTLYRYLNDTYWPASYAHMRRMADFQNRLFASYSIRYGLEFLDVASDFPLDPDLFGDAVHLVPEGLRLQAWIYLQQLIPVVEARLKSGRWPRPNSNRAPGSRAEHSPHLVKRDTLMSSCR